MAKTNQEPITRSLYLPYKFLESTLSDEKLFLEIVSAKNLSRPNEPTNQPIRAQLCSFTCTFLCSEEFLTKMAESVR